VVLFHHWLAMPGFVFEKFDLYMSFALHKNHTLDLPYIFAD